MVTPGVMEREVFAVAAMAIGKTACVRAAVSAGVDGGTLAESARAGRSQSASGLVAGYGALCGALISQRFLLWGPRSPLWPAGRPAAVTQNTVQLELELDRWQQQ